MNYKLLKEREDVIAVLINSINDFYKGEVVVSIDDPGNSVPFYGNEYLNFIASTSCDSDNFSVVIKEYSRTNKWWKKIIQFLYVKVFTLPLFYKRFNHFKLYISGTGINEIKHLLFMGGNTRFRTVDARNQSTTIFAKKGYPSKFINNERKWRSKIESTLVPGIIASGENFITEKLHPGIPINRLNQTTTKSHRKKVYGQIWNDCFFLHLLLSKSYIKELIDKIENSLKKLGLVKDDFSKVRNTIVDEHAYTCLTHGDLQDANILLTNDGVKLIDWESVRLRSFMYDWVILFGNIRHENIQEPEIKELIRKRLNEVDFEDSNRARINLYYTIFLLEELEYRLEYALLSSILIKRDLKRIDNLMVLIKDSIDE